MDQRKAKYENDKLMKRLRHCVGQAIGDYQMIEDGDLVMVCMSGGKDSYAMLDILQSLREKAPVRFDLLAVHLDGGLPGYPDGLMENYLKDRGVPYKIIREPVFSIVKEKIPSGRNVCSLCSRLRRGILYRTATETGASKIALGHHREDLLETFLLNLFHTGQLKSMPPKLLTDDRKHIVIRPLAYCAEKDLIRLAQIREYPLISGDLCRFSANKQRGVIKEMLRQWERQQPGRTEIMARALANVKTSHLLDRSVYPFTKLQADGSPSLTGETRKDAEEEETTSSWTAAGVQMDRSADLSPDLSADQ